MNACLVEVLDEGVGVGAVVGVAVAWGDLAGEMTSMGSMISERRVRRRGGAGRVMCRAEVEALRGAGVGMVGEVGRVGVDVVVVGVVRVGLSGEEGVVRLEVGLDCF